MNTEQPFPKATEKLIAAKAQEVAGILALIKPLCKRVGSLTKAEQEILFNTLLQADRVLNDAVSMYYLEKFLPKPEQGTAIRVV